MIHIVPSISNKSSGPSYSVVRLCETLIKSGLKVKLATLDYKKKNLPSFVKSFKNEFIIKKIGHSKLMYKWLEDQIKINKNLIIHNHSLWMMPNIYPGVLRTKYGNPLVISPRGTLSKWSMSNGSIFKKFIWHLLQKRVINNAVCFHATSEIEYGEIRTLGFKNPVGIIPNGIDIYEGIEKKFKKKNKKKLLYLGRIHKKKGLDILLIVWSKLQDLYQDWDLKIVGPDDNNYINELNPLIKKLKLKRVFFSKKKEGEKKWREYLSSDLFVLPSHSENFGVTIAEALSVGLPVVTTTNTPWKKLEEYKAGWCINLSVENMYQCLSHAMKLDEKLLHNLGENGKNWMKKDYSWEMVGEKILKTYSWIQNKEKKPDFIF
jgi:glycosyltransferase involved in cell wall biosynthesis